MGKKEENLMGSRGFGWMDDYEKSFKRYNAIKESHDEALHGLCATFAQELLEKISQEKFLNIGLDGSVGFGCLSEELPWRDEKDLTDDWFYQRFRVKPIDGLKDYFQDDEPGQLSDYSKERALVLRKSLVEALEYIDSMVGN